jgi:hypothetical protein
MKQFMKFIPASLGLMLSLAACENGDIEFDDYEGGTTVYFATQAPVRTLVLGDDEYDLTLDHAHKCKIVATFGGSYNGSNGTVSVAVDNSLVKNLYQADGTALKAMPESYYTLGSQKWSFGGGFMASTEVQFSDAFFNDPLASENTYVIPLVITGQTGFGQIATGTPLEEGASPARTDESQWETTPKDYVLYCVKFLNKYSGYWLTNGTTSTADIEKANVVQITSRTLNTSVYTVSFADERDTYTADLLLTFDGNDQCTITSLTQGVTASGNGAWTDNGEKNSWNSKDRDAIDLNYTVQFGGGKTFSTQERLVWQRSGVTVEELSLTYNE